ncbi:hypothetical protein IGI04_015250 [Brassica rapa subsp. trilocularis]|uniref:Uncharacterized protein n=1 Tax=Brassica rapa subsp. trilocularis TaxID=1813537 RepID=A0ABQ7MPI3_BRACM|nr:hypothetical protein IGI04_015250 [Brassica rapa subsp. trilocularis]
MSVKDEPRQQRIGKHKDGDLLAHVLTAPKELSTKEESKDYEEDWKKAGKRENVDIERGNEAEGKVSKILADGIFGDRVKEDATLSKIHTNNQEESQSKAVPGKELQKEDAPDNSIINAVSNSQRQRRRNKTRSMADSGDSTAKLSQIAFQIKGARRWKLESVYGIIEGDDKREKARIWALGGDCREKSPILSWPTPAQQESCINEKET